MQRWVVRRNRYGVPEVYTEDGEQCICDRIFNGNEDKIAALPELLDAARAVLAAVDDIEDTHENRKTANVNEDNFYVVGNLGRSTVENLRAAIHKAIMGDKP